MLFEEGAVTVGDERTTGTTFSLPSSPLSQPTLHGGRAFNSQAVMSNVGKFTSDSSSGLHEIGPRAMGLATPNSSGGEDSLPPLRTTLVRSEYGSLGSVDAASGDRVTGNGHNTFPPPANGTDPGSARKTTLLVRRNESRTGNFGAGSVSVSGGMGLERQHGGGWVDDWSDAAVLSDGRQSANTSVEVVGPDGEDPGSEASYLRSFPPTSSVWSGPVDDIPAVLSSTPSQDNDFEKRSVRSEYGENSELEELAGEALVKVELDGISESVYVDSSASVVESVCSAFQTLLCVPHVRANDLIVRSKDGLSVIPLISFRELTRQVTPFSVSRFRLQSGSTVSLRHTHSIDWQSIADARWRALCKVENSIIKADERLAALLSLPQTEAILDTCADLSDTIGVIVAYMKKLEGQKLPRPGDSGANLKLELNDEWSVLPLQGTATVGHLCRSYERAFCLCPIAPSELVLVSADGVESMPLSMLNTKSIQYRSPFVETQISLKYGMRLALRSVVDFDWQPVARHRGRALQESMEVMKRAENGLLSTLQFLVGANAVQSVQDLQHAISLLKQYLIHGVGPH